jgi:hypothetical protein
MYSLVSLKLILVLFSFHSLCFAEVEFKTSKVHGVVKFAELLGADHPEYWNLIDEKNRKLVRKKVRRFNKLKTKNLMSGSTWQLMLWQSMLAISLDDLDEKMTGLTKIHVQAEVISLLKTLMVFYDPFWRANRNHLNGFINKGLPILSKNESSKSLIKAIRTFYGTTWPKERAFPIGLYLVPERTRVTGASSFDTFEEAAVKVNDELYGRLGVIVHEMCHSYYANQDKKLSQQMKAFYENYKSPFAKHAYSYMNEALATVLGNGIFYEKLTGKRDKDWYNDEIIDGFAKALLPMTLKYIKNNKTMDQAYFAESINIFAKTFPDMNKKIKFLANKPLFSTQGKLDFDKVNNLFFNTLNLQSHRISAPFVHKYTREYYDNSNNSLVLVINNWNQNKSKKVHDMYPELGEKISLIMKSKQGWGYFFNSGKFHLIIRYEDEENFKSILANIKKRKSID